MIPDPPSRAARRRRRLVALVVAVLALAFTPAAEARYRPFTFRELCARADQVVLGVIVSVTETTFSFQVERAVLVRRGVEPTATGERVVVTKFRDWTCARRWTAYAPGQRAVLFIARRSGDWHVLGAGNEGEMPVEGGSIFIDGNVTHFFDAWTVYGVSRLCGRLSVDEVLRAVEMRTNLPGRPR